VRRSSSLAAALAVALALAAQAAGAAHGPARIAAISAARYPTIDATVVTARPNEPAPAVRENGRKVVGLNTFNLGRGKSFVTAVDVSRSMVGKPLADAAAAARAFVDAKPNADRVAIVAFGRRAVKLTGFSSSTIDADSALRSLSVDSRQGTALYDAVVIAARALKSDPLGARVIVLLTDGRDVSSRASLAQAVAAARDAGASIYPIAIASKDFDPSALQQLARDTNGTYHEAASSAVLHQVYGSIAAELSRTWKIEYVTAARPGDRISLAAAVRGEGTTSAALQVPGASPTDPTPDSKLPSPAFSLVGTLMLAGLVGVAVLAVVLLLLSAKRGSWVKARLAPHLGETRRGPVSTKERLSFLTALFRATESAFGTWKQWRSIARMLERADVPLRTVEFFWLSAGSGVFFGLVAAVFGAAPIVILLLMGLAGAAPYGFVSFKVRRRARAFEDQLPDILTTIAGSLKAGHSFKQGLQSVVDEDQQPASTELRRVLTETSLGRPMDDALAEMADRTGSENFQFAITAVTIQRQVGGSLAGLFDMVAETVRQRQQFARKIRGLTAMGRMSAYVLVGLPFFVALAITVMNPGYMGPLYHTGTGHYLIVGTLVMMSLGSLMLKKIVSFRG
jgi:tight adherence protein B